MTLPRPELYSVLIGLDQIWDDVDQIAYSIDETVQFTISQDAGVVISEEWSFQLGWATEFGVHPTPRSEHTSWSIPLSPAAFRGAVRRLQDAGVISLRPEPSWVGYWSYAVKDPMGRTVELADPTTPGPEEEQ